MTKFNWCVVLIFLTSGCAALPPKSLSALDQTHRQALYVKVNEDAPSTAQMSMWELRKGRWRQVIAPMKAVIGRNGMAPFDHKREGDGRTPSGVYDVHRAFGYMPKFHTGLKYSMVTVDDIWVDDPESPDYNHWITAPTAAKSFEKLKRDDDLYKLAVVIEYNTDNVVPGRGSAIFVHNWRDKHTLTAGCVAVKDKNLTRVVRRLNQKQAPVIVLER